MTADELEQAACRGVGPALFYPEQGETPRHAIALCQECPVRRPCGEAGRSEHFGVWGGMSPRARRWVRVEGGRRQARKTTREDPAAT